jgi:hypothetical protein
MAFNCVAVIRRIKRTTPNATNTLFTSDLIDVPWSHWKDWQRNIPSKGYRLLDLCHVMIGEPYATQDPTNAMFIVGRSDNIPERLGQDLILNATYEFTVDIYADNAAPTQACCLVTVGRNWTDVDITPLPRRANQD